MSRKETHRWDKAMKSMGVDVELRRESKIHRDSTDSVRPNNLSKKLWINRHHRVRGGQTMETAMHWISENDCRSVWLSVSLEPKGSGTQAEQPEIVAGRFDRAVTFTNSSHRP